MLIGFVFLCLLVGIIGGWWTELGVHSWYPHIVKPSWTPPNWVFAPVWTVLYLLMALSIWLVWKEPTTISKKSAYLYFGLQLFANLIWSGLFFALECPRCALIDLIVLWFLIVGTISSFYEIKPIAAYLLIPYLLWSSYALSLNAAIWWLN